MTKPTTKSDSYIIRLSSAVVIDGCTTQCVGPFASTFEAEEWVCINSDGLKAVNTVTVDWLAPPMQIGGRAQ